MPDEIEMQKRANYFALGRDDFMALEEYLLSGLSDKDLGRAEGGLASLPGYDTGGMLLKDRLAKIDKNIASVRTKPNLFFDLVKQAGFVKKDGSADIKKFNKAAAKVGIDTKDRSASNMNRITKFLNKASAGAYKNVGMFSGKSGLENFASRIKGLIGYYAEKNSAFAKKEFWDDAKKLQRKVNKLKISSAEKVKEVARGLKLKWAVPIGTTTTLLTKIGFGKALPIVGHLITTEMGSGELPKEGTQEYEELMQGLNEEDEKGLEITVPLSYTQEKAPTERFKGGGMADIYDMTRPLKGYNLGGPAGMTDLERTGYDRSESSAWNINDLVRDVGGDIGGSFKKFIKNARENWFAPKQYEGGDDPEYMKLFNFFWEKGYDSDQIDAIIRGEVDPTEIVPSRTGDLTEPFTGAKGGIVSLNHLTRRL